MAQANEQDPNTQPQVKETAAQKKKRLAAEAEAAAAAAAAKADSNDSEKSDQAGEGETNSSKDASGTTDTPQGTSDASDENTPGGDKAGDSLANDENAAKSNEAGNVTPSENNSELLHTTPTLGTTTEPELAETEALGPLQLLVKNNGSKTHCTITHVELPSKESVKITYPNSGKKALAQRNFAQLNALAGKKRFEVEG